MADDTASSGEGSGGTGGKRRDFLTLATVGMGAWGVGAFVWPFVNSLAPAADVLAQASIDVDLSQLAEGEAITVDWRGSPVFVRYRTEAEIQQARDVDWRRLPDPQPDEERVVEPEYLVTVGVCTHLGCIPLGQNEEDPRGEWGGYFCPCHGSHYDTSGRVRKGPAPENLEVPPYSFTEENVITIG